MKPHPSKSARAQNSDRHLLANTVGETSGNIRERKQARQPIRHAHHHHYKHPPVMMLKTVANIRHCQLSSLYAPASIKKIWSVTRDDPPYKRPLREDRN